MRPLLKVCALAGAVLGAGVGCQGLLGIEDATLRQPSSGGASGAGPGGAAGVGASAVNGGEGVNVGGDGGDGLSSRIRYKRVADTFGAMVVGSDGNFWLALGASIRRVTPDWQVTDFPLPEGSTPEGLALGMDDNVWFTRGDRMGRITPAGGIMEYMMPDDQLQARWTHSGPDSNLWFIGPSTLGKLSIAGKFELFTPPPNSDLWSITSGDDGTLWLTDKRQNAIVSISVDGMIAGSWSVPTTDALLGDITQGPDKNLWFLEGGAHKLGTIVQSGVYRGKIAEYPLPAGGIPGSLVAGPDGALWITLYDTKQLIRSTTSGEITDVYPLLDDWKYPGALVVGPDDNLWFAANGNLVRFEL
jgi:virginiamycin B lyase